MAGEGVERIGVRPIGHGVVVVVGVAGVAKAVAVGVGPVVGDVRAARDGAVVTRIAIQILTEEWIERRGVGPIGHGVVVVIGVSGVTDAVAVGVGPVIGGARNARHRTVVAGIAVGISADERVERRRIGAVGDPVVVVVGIARVADAIRVGIGAVVRDVRTARDGAVVTGVAIGVLAAKRVEWRDVAPIRHGVVVVVGVAGVAEAVPIGVGAVVEGVEGPGRTVVAGIAVGVGAHEAVQRVGVGPIHDAIVVIIGVPSVAQAVPVEIGSVVARVDRPARTVVAGVTVGILALERVGGVRVPAVVHTIVVVVGVDIVAEAVSVGVELADAAAAETGLGLQRVPRALVDAVGGSVEVGIGGAERHRGVRGEGDVLPLADCGGAGGHGDRRQHERRAVPEQAVEPRGACEREFPRQDDVADVGSPLIGAHSDEGIALEAGADEVRVRFDDIDVLQGHPGVEAGHDTAGIDGVEERRTFPAGDDPSGERSVGRDVVRENRHAFECGAEARERGRAGRAGRVDHPHLPRAGHHDELIPEDAGRVLGDAATDLTVAPAGEIDPRIDDGRPASRSAHDIPGRAVPAEDVAGSKAAEAERADRSELDLAHEARGDTELRVRRIVMELSEGVGESGRVVDRDDQGVVRSVVGKALRAAADSGDGGEFELLPVGSGCSNTETGRDHETVEDPHRISSPRPPPRRPSIVSPNDTQNGTDPISRSCSRKSRSLECCRDLAGRRPSPHHVQFPPCCAEGRGHRSRRGHRNKRSASIRQSPALLGVPPRRESSRVGTFVGVRRERLSRRAARERSQVRPDREVPEPPPRWRRSACFSLGASYGYARWSARPPSLFSGGNRRRRTACPPWSSLRSSTVGRGG